MTFGLVGIGRGSSVHVLDAGRPTLAGLEIRVAHGPGVVEWWRALGSGLEHGVTLTRRPGGEGAIALDVAVGGEVHAVLASEDAVELSGASGRVVARYTHLVVLDAAQARVPAHMAVAAGAIRIEVDDARARYPLVVDPIFTTEEATLVASGAAADDGFGGAVALSADGNRALVGVSGDDTAAVNAGSARVFVRSGRAWAEEATLQASAPQPADNLGASVALSADGSLALVGAPLRYVGGLRWAGVAYVFARSGSGWAEQAALRASGALGDELFGTSVALSADGDRALVGAPGDAYVESTAYLRGAKGEARVFVRSGATWAEEATLVASDAAAHDLFGTSVALSADGSRALVGASGDVTGVGAHSGSARVFVRSGASWTEEATLVSPDQRGFGGAGVSVALSGDGMWALVGDPAAWPRGYGSAGSAYVFARTGTSWTDHGTLVASPLQSHLDFGYTVALSADGSRALVGARADDTPAGINAGSARLFTRSGALWTEQAPLVASDGVMDDLLGFWVALAADGTRALVGARDDDTLAGANVGSARVFTLSECTTGADCASGFCGDGACCGEACGGGSSDDCMACAHDLTGLADGTCGAVLATAAVTCRAATGACDVAEVCTGTSTVCPADIVVAGCGDDGGLDGGLDGGMSGAPTPGGCVVSGGAGSRGAPLAGGLLALLAIAILVSRRRRPGRAALFQPAPPTTVGNTAV